MVIVLESSASFFCIPTAPRLHVCRRGLQATSTCQALCGPIFEWGVAGEQGQSNHSSAIVYLQTGETIHS